MPQLFGSAAIAALVVLATFQQAYAQTDKPGPWKLGRATYYGKDGWSIHHGSCGYGYLDPAKGTGWDVAAMSDSNRDWDSRGSFCGKCKELRCKTMWFMDGYGQKLEREYSCFDSDASIVVTISDTCPCLYPGNYYSNRRWCCGDMYHLDVSLWAYEKLADTKWGVISIEWRDVPCWYRPVKRAKNPYGKISSGERPAPKDWKASYDKRPWNPYGFYPDYVPTAAALPAADTAGAATDAASAAVAGRKLRGVGRGQ